VTDVTARGQQQEDSRTAEAADAAQEKAQEVKEQGQQKAQEVSQEIQQRAGAATDQLQEKAEEVRGQAAGRIRQEVDTRSSDAGEQVTTFADALRRTSSTLREEGQDSPAKVADTVADKIEQVGSYLRDSNADRLLDDAEDFARSKPWAVAGAGAALGLLGARFMKASSQRRHQQRTGGGTSALPPAPRPERQLPSGTRTDRVGDLRVEHDVLTQPAPVDRPAGAPTVPPATSNPAPLGGRVAPPGSGGITPGTGAGELAKPIDPPARPGGSR
jgi:ElaB/YqjD/DUF883 family membrane-anchored ribosome-binding protein